MAVRTALLTSRNINLDTDFSKYIESVTTAGIISGFTVTASSVAAGTAWVPCTRTNGDTIYALVQNFSAVSISGNGHVIIKVDDTIVDNGGGSEDGTGIATISVVDTLPSKNYLELATISSGTVTPVAPTIKKLNELNTEIESIFSQLADLDERVEALEEADAIDHLEESGIVWELYTLNDTLFKQYAPTLANSTIEANVWDVAANTEIHIQAIGSGEASNTLKLKVKMAGSPTTSLKVEVRKGIQVTVTENVEAYWYGDSNNIYATGTLASSSFSSSWAEVTFTLDNAVGGTKWELLDVVVYQTTGSGATVNASNYYVLACDSTQYSEGFSYVSVNGSTRARSKLMPYLSSVWFVQAMLSKTKEYRNIGNNYSVMNTSGSTSASASGKQTNLYNNQNQEYFKWPGKMSFSISHTFSKVGSYNSYGYAGIFVYVDEVLVKTISGGDSTTPNNGTTTFNYTVTTGGTHSIRVFLSGDYSSGSSYVTISVSSATATFQGGIDGHKGDGKPSEVKSLWDLGIITIFWIINNDFFVGFTSNTATTGSITPGNFVGYIKIGNYKIPYYNE